MGILQTFIYENSRFMGISYFAISLIVILLTCLVLKHFYKSTLISTLQQIPFLEAKHILYVATSIVSLTIYGIDYYEEYEDSVILSNLNTTKLFGKALSQSQQEVYVSDRLEDADEAIFNSVGFFIIASLLLVLLSVQIKKVLFDEEYD